MKKAKKLLSMKDAGIDVCREGFTEQWIAYCEEYGYK